MQRMGMVIGLNADRVAEYKRLHTDVWPGILDMISACNITNYSIFLKEPENLLFGYWEYTGTDFEAEDLTTGDTAVCTFKNFPDHFGFFPYEFFFQHLHIFPPKNFQLPCGSPHLLL